jgi:phosphoribosylaminoimidazole-succinocarboxamide synthase
LFNKIAYFFHKGIPGKGKLLTQMSVFWFNYLKDILPNHIITAEFDQMPEKVQKYRDQLEYRSLLVKNLKVFSVEAIVRGYITGKTCYSYLID